MRCPICGKKMGLIRNSKDIKDVYYCGGTCDTTVIVPASMKVNLEKPKIPEPMVLHLEEIKKKLHEEG